LSTMFDSCFFFVAGKGLLRGLFGFSDFFFPPIPPSIPELVFSPLVLWFFFLLVDNSERVGPFPLNYVPCVSMWPSSCWFEYLKTVSGVYIFSVPGHCFMGMAFPLYVILFPACCSTLFLSPFRSTPINFFLSPLPPLFSPKVSEFLPQPSPLFLCVFSSPPLPNLLGES